METQQIVLIVDDEKMNRSLLADLLKPLYKVLGAKNGEQALKIASRGEGQPDLILLDIMMPEMDGYEVCRRLKAEDATREIPIVFVTAMSEVSDETKGFELGAVDYITKPVSPPIVLARVKTHLRLKHKSDLLDKLVSMDGLTEIPNRRAFDTALEKQWKQGQRSKTPLSVVMMDMDMFKQFNDNYGHSAGDDCLKTVAGALARVAHRPGDIVARYGGEEFCAALADTNLEGALILGEKFRAAVEDLKITHDYSNTASHVTISIGVATIIPGEVVPSQDLQVKADGMLYQAKEGGRNRVMGEQMES